MPVRFNDIFNITDFHMEHQNRSPENNRNQGIFVC